MITARRLHATAILLCCSTATYAEAARPNVLFVAVDDLRPQLGCYGVTEMISPNIDRLAAGGVLFRRAYCMVPVCGASRASLMTGVRPSRNRFVSYLARADREAPGALTLNAHFRNNGYHTVSNGKVFHVREDSAGGWSETPWRPKSVPTYRLAENLSTAAERAEKLGARKGRGPPYESADVRDDAYGDGKIAEKTISDLRRLRGMGKPFFLAVGFLKPHLPFVAPKRYWDMYEGGKVRLPGNYFRPENAPDAAMHNFGELRSYAGVPAKGPVSDDLARTLIHGYYACVSYVDAQIGRVLDELHRIGLAGNTIVVLWGDHGWQLGEHALWCKHSNFETSMRAPLIVRAPGVDGGKARGDLVEFVDIYPTLCDLAGLALPDHLQGRSLLSLMKGSDRGWKTSAVGRYRRGDSIRTDRYRYTEYTDAKGGFIARMLYDHRADPDENTNIAERPGNREIVERLAAELRRGMGRDRPNAPAGAQAPARARADAADSDGTLASFTIREPLGIDWRGEWLDRRVSLTRETAPEDLGLLGADGRPVPAQFSPVSVGDETRDRRASTVLFRTDLARNATVSFRVVERPPTESFSAWRPVIVSQRGPRTTISNGIYRVVLDANEPLPINALFRAEGEASLVQFAWPETVKVTGVRDDWLERGPARAKIQRTFSFGDAAHRYDITFDFRAEDPWIGIVDAYTLGAGSAIVVDLRALGADRVYHPHTYNARTFRAGGVTEDSTLEPPQHPIATLGPIWRDIWFGGGPFAFVYNAPNVVIPEGANRKKTKELHRAAEAASDSSGVGFAAVRGSRWDTPDGITPESQNLEVHGDSAREGEVFVRIPTDGGTRHWAMIVGGPGVRHSIGGMVRSHSDTPLGKVLDEWVVDWESRHPPHSFGLAGQWLGYFNRHSLNPTTFPRRIRVPEKPVKSRDLAVIAYQFSNPDYWPGPKYKWRIGNPNFHTDMYSVPLKIGLAMPDHPHSRRWVQHGVEETYGNLMRDSYRGGAWAESLSYSKYFFHVAEYAKRIQDAKAAAPLEDWPRIKEVAIYLACMHTPVDPRYGARQMAPIGDTSPGDYIENLHRVAEYYRGIDDDFARKLAAFPGGGEGALDISSREFYGFGAMLRGNPYDPGHESFVTVKAGPARNHYQGDELSFYFASLSTPLAIDHACHYSPRPWSASMHNRPDLDGHRPVAVARRRAFKKSAVADVFVADERTRMVNEVPMAPHDTVKPGWNYPWRSLPEDAPWTMRRYSMLVKHDPRRSELADYLVLRDEIDAPEPVWWNLHALARRIERSGQVFRFPGQLGVDLEAHFLAPAVGRFEDRQWGWASGKSSLRRSAKGKRYEELNFGRWIPEDFEPGTWKGGEMSKWLRVWGEPGRTGWLVVLIPHRKGRSAPAVTGLSDTKFRVSLGGESEVVHLGSDGEYQAAVERRGKLEVLLRPGDVRPWSELEFMTVPHRSDRVGQRD